MADMNQTPPSHSAELSPTALQQALHELRAHQIELEMQNEELRRAQTALDAERARYFDLYDLAPVGYCTLSEHGLVLEANLTLATLLGVTRSELVRRPVSRYIVPADQDVYYLHRNLLFRTGQPQDCELRMLKQDGTAFWVHLAATHALDSEGQPLHRLTLSDISDRQKLNQALQEKNAELDKARQLADQANLAKSEFLSSMSHELRSPLNAILGFAQLMEAGSPAPTPRQQASLDQILRGGWYLLELINEILDLAAIESGQHALTMEAVSLPEKFRDCLSLVEAQADKNAIRLSFAAFDGPCHVQADRTRLKQVIVNLLSNAIKYNRPQGSVEVRHSVSAGGRVRISVHDCGHGLSAEKIAKLFQPFNRLGQEGGSQEGTGIGLVVCKRLVELMGGEIGVQSTVGVGSVFWFDLKLADAPANAGTAGPASDASAPLPAAVAPPTGVRTLLYVEDNPANMELVEQLVARRADLRLLKSGNGSSGIALARIHQPDVILLDINLPGINGFQVLNILRDDPLTRHIPVLALSANAMPHDIDNGLSAGFFRYLTKPIKIDQFMQALDQALRVGP